MKKQLPQAIAGLLIIVAIPFQLIGQTPPAIQWQHSYGGTQPDAAHSITPTDDGGYILAGRTDSNDGDVSGHFGERDIWVVKLRSDGTLEWQRCYGGTWQEQNVTVIHQTSDGGYILGGTTSSFDGNVDCPDPPASRIWVAKLDPSGQIEWQRCVGGAGFDTFASIAIAPDGYALCGHSSSTDGDAVGNHGLTDLILVKLDHDGATLWSRCYGGSGSDVGRQVIATADGGYLLTGQTQSNDGDLTGINPYHIPPVPGTTGWILKVDDVGEVLWQRCVGGFSNDFLYSVRETPDGSIWAVGYTDSNDGDVIGNHGDGDAWVVRLGALGDLTGNRCLGGAGGDRLYEAHVLPSGNVVAVGYTNSADGDVTNPLGSVDVWAVCLSPGLEILWQRTLGGSAGDQGEGITLASDGGVVIVGYSQSSDGDLTSNNGSGDLWVVKLEPLDDTGLDEATPLEFSVFPNPAMEMITVDLAVKPKSGDAIEVFDALGRSVLARQAVTSHVVNLSVAELQAGSYCVLLHHGTEVRTRRFVKH